MPELDPEMQSKTARAAQLIENLASVRSRIITSARGAREIRLVAVSKLKPPSDILALHTASAPQVHFGENYQQELLAKSQQLPRSIRWHFTGALQTNKCKTLAEQIPNLWCVESLDTPKKADKLEKGRAALLAAPETREAGFLHVFVQVNTSGEESKSGIEPWDAPELCRHVRDNCPHLRLIGLMTIGSIARSKATTAETANEDFITLRETRDRVAEALGLQAEALEMSMGMSEDFEGAIAQGSSEVRIGSTIFGERPLRQDFKIENESS
ncbi:MAG: hypothetical protein M1829_000569 [Trizodia sp. TS-e1964]|nr:MAG: hypothetical protein M1829_000569 [Trizodia sp. TS-e1964]